MLFLPSVILLLLAIVRVNAENAWLKYPKVKKWYVFNGLLDRFYDQSSPCVQSCIKNVTKDFEENEDRGVPCPRWDTGCFCYMPLENHFWVKCVAESCPQHMKHVYDKALTACDRAGLGRTMMLLPDAEEILKNALAKPQEKMVAPLTKTIIPANGRRDTSKSVDPKDDDSTIGVVETEDEKMAPGSVVDETSDDIKVMSSFTLVETAHPTSRRESEINEDILGLKLNSPGRIVSDEADSGEVKSQDERSMDGNTRSSESKPAQEAGSSSTRDSDTESSTVAELRSNDSNDNMSSGGVSSQELNSISSEKQGSIYSLVESSQSGSVKMKVHASIVLEGNAAKSTLPCGTLSSECHATSKSTVAENCVNCITKTSCAESSESVTIMKEDQSVVKGKYANSTLPCGSIDAKCNAIKVHTNTVTENCVECLDAGSRAKGPESGPVMKEQSSIAKKGNTITSTMPCGKDGTTCAPKSTSASTAAKNCDNCDKAAKDQSVAMKAKPDSDVKNVAALMSLMDSDAVMDSNAGKSLSVAFGPIVAIVIVAFL